MTGIVWLASYPKSGNTWFRTFLTNYMRDADEPADINALDSELIASARMPLDNALGYDCGDLTHEEIDRLRPELYEHMASGLKTSLFCKVHDAYYKLADGRALFPKNATHAVLYLIRNPLDVCVSFSHHSGHEDHAATARKMADDSHCFCESKRRQSIQMRQQLLSWSSHVRSWLDADLPVHAMRYEDMQLNAEATFADAVRHVGLEFSIERLRKALQFSNFSELQRQELEKGFSERHARARSFFRKGAIGSWRDALPDTLVKKLIDDHRDVMQRFHYLDERGMPVF